MNLPKRDEENKGLYSYSQHKKWREDKKAYILSYFFKERFSGNAYTDFGSKVGEALENGDYSGFDKVEVKMLSKATRLDEFERPINWKFKDFTVLGYIDTIDKELTTLVDYKTGALNKVSVYEDDSYDQLGIYAGAIQQETGKLPTKAYVELIERTGNPFQREELALGTFIVNIPQDVSPKKIKQIKREIEQAVKEISQYYSVFEFMNSCEI
tara:strand:- start:55922 stop:56557 length:636 start_codon:yes stop_codon:yes gene_type:complete